MANAFLELIFVTSLIGVYPRSLKMNLFWVCQIMSSSEADVSLVLGGSFFVLAMFAMRASGSEER